ncbi:basic leucine-zipper 44 [Hibiscus trionum]|uniref:Basic leucine-zipper 44 n=1 Tax=Hibiscus trionum TaxID=183268 RepID=A0A9W7HR08_HIBTR|nr:basic leucine-zipper 44 [Hibiscus trionum]
MASSGGNSNSTSSSQLQNSGSEEELHQMNMMDQRKRKRKESNRESARRSRMRKQQHLDDLMAQVTQLSEDNNQILTSINFTTHHYMNIQAQNSVLRAQLTELSQRLDSLNQILSNLNATSSNGSVYETDQCFEAGGGDHSFNNPFNLPYLNQAITASPDIFQYY